MKELIRELRDEHAVILDKLDELERTIATSASADVTPFVEFFETYVDGRHHAREEGELFVRMREDPFLSQMAEQLTEEHDQGRRTVGRMRSGADAVRLLKGYADDLRRHIAKEETMIFDAAQAALADA